MEGIIWYNPLYKDEAEQVYLEIKDYYSKWDKIRRDKHSINDTHFITDDGDVWSLVPAKENARGRACNVSYIQRSIPAEIIETIIMPATKSQPWQAHRFFGESYSVLSTFSIS